MPPLTCFSVAVVGARHPATIAFSCLSLVTLYLIPQETFWFAFSRQSEGRVRVACEVVNLYGTYLRDGLSSQEG